MPQVEQVGQNRHADGNHWMVSEMYCYECVSQAHGSFVPGNNRWNAPLAPPPTAC